MHLKHELRKESHVNTASSRIRSNCLQVLGLIFCLIDPYMLDLLLLKREGHRTTVQILRSELLTNEPCGVRHLE